MMGMQPPASEVLHTELAAVAGETCGWSCEHHWETFPPCQRAKGHAGALVLIDVHVARVPGGELITATEHCCAGP